MIFQDISKGGEISVPENSQQDVIFDNDPSSEEVVMKQTINMEVIAGEEKRIIDSTKLIPSIVLNNLTDVFYLRYQAGEQPLPAVIFPREIL